MMREKIYIKGGENHDDKRTRDTREHGGGKSTVPDQ